MRKITIGSRTISQETPTFFIADIAANHDGDIERAKDLIHLAARAGADAAKFQHFKAAKIVSEYGFKSLGEQASHQKAWKKSVFEVYADASVPDDWHDILFAECRKAGLEYATSPYDFASVDRATPHVSFFKVGSGDITWSEICCHIAGKKKPVMLATGASHMEEVERAVSAMLAINQDIVLMQCNTNYTGSVDNFRYVNLRVLGAYAQRWPDLALGLSDHTPGHASVLGAVALGARVVEKHFTDNPFRNGPDHAFSLTPQAWREMVDRTRELEAALGDGIKRVEANEMETVILQRRSLRAVRDLPVGHILVDEDLEALRPAPLEGVPPIARGSIIGKTLTLPICAGEHITASHVRD